jgi:hypothetical protein
MFTANARRNRLTTAEAGAPGRARRRNRRARALALASAAAAVVALAVPAGAPAQQLVVIVEDAPITGSGTYNDPYKAPCVTPQQSVCETHVFAARSLTGLWANEYVPAYKCPTSHPYLYNHNYAPAGTRLPSGVEVVGLGPIGVSITATQWEEGPAEWDGWIYAYNTATSTGFPDTSATNWTAGTNYYQVKLHCTNVRSQASRWKLEPHSGGSKT